MERVYYRSALAILIWSGTRAEDGMPRRGLEWWQCVVLQKTVACCRKYLTLEIKTKTNKQGCGNTANVLLEFMHKSNNTKRNEATQESSSHTARPPSSASLFISSRDTQRNVLLLCKNKTETTLRRDSVTNHWQSSHRYKPGWSWAVSNGIETCFFKTHIWRLLFFFFLFLINWEKTFYLRYRTADTHTHTSWALK